MPEDGVAGNLERAAEHFLRGANPLPRKGQRLGISQIERGREINRQVVAEFILGQRARRCGR